MSRFALIVRTLSKVMRLRRCEFSAFAVVRIPGGEGFFIFNEMYVSDTPVALSALFCSRGLGGVSRS